jgi:hypothetical protein
MKKIALSAARLQHVFEALCQESYQTVGPTIRDGLLCMMSYPAWTTYLS